MTILERGELTLQEHENLRKGMRLGKAAVDLYLSSEQAAPREYHFTATGELAFVLRGFESMLMEHIVPDLSDQPEDLDDRKEILLATNGTNQLTRQTIAGVVMERGQIVGHELFGRSYRIAPATDDGPITSAA